MQCVMFSALRCLGHLGQSWHQATVRGAAGLAGGRGAPGPVPLAPCILQMAHLPSLVLQAPWATAEPAPSWKKQRRIQKELERVEKRTTSLKQRDAFPATASWLFSLPVKHKKRSLFFILLPGAVVLVLHSDTQQSPYAVLSFFSSACPEFFLSSCPLVSGCSLCPY